MRSIFELLKVYTDEWMKIPGVVGTGEGLHRGKPCILILVQKNTQELMRKIPKLVDGYPVIIQETGEVKAL